MHYESRVQVREPGGARYRYATHASQAARMVECGQARPLGNGKKPIREIELIDNSPGATHQPATQTGNKYTYEQDLGNGLSVIQHKAIYPGERHLFRLSVLENIVASPR